MTAVATTLTRQSPTTVLFDQLRPFYNEKYGYDGSEESKQYVQNRLDHFAENYPTLGDVADHRHRAIYTRTDPDLALDAKGECIMATLTEANIIRPLTVESTLRELALHFLEHSEKPPQATQILYSRVRNSIDAVLGDDPENPAFTVKNLRGVPYKNVGELVADQENAKLALKKSWLLGQKGSDLLFDHLHAHGIGDGPYKGIQ